MRNEGQRPDTRVGASSMRRLNSALLLQLIRANGRVSRADLARLSGLAKPTVSSQVADLLRRGLVVEAGNSEPDARGGKPSRLLHFNLRSGFVAGAEIGSAGIRVRLSDLDGEILDRIDLPGDPERGAEYALATLLNAIREVLARGRGRKSKLLAATVAAPGRVDAASGTVLEAGNVFHWRNVAVRERLAASLGVPILVENDVNLAALGEQRFGTCRGVKNFALIRLGTGVGAGLVLDGHLYQGGHWAAGEIAHMILDREAVSATPDERGYLESAIGSDRLQAKAQSCGNGGSADMLDELATNVGLAAANLAAAIDPELIVLNGELLDPVLDRVREIVGRVIPWPVRIERSALGADAALLGALASACTVAHQELCGFGRGNHRP